MITREREREREREGGESGPEQMHTRVVKDRRRLAKILSNSWLNNSTAFLKYLFCFV
jgi:hypothetical protein